MDAQQTKQLSKFLSLVLRHEPQTIGIALDGAGWVAVDELLAGLARAGKRVTREQLVEVVATNDKRRFAFSDDGLWIRAQQGHSVEVDLGYKPADPPARLHHGTVARFLDAIRAEGLTRGSRHHVHLSATTETAVQVGGRRGKPVVLTVLAAEMHAAGHAFFVTPNGVWLTERVPPEFIEFSGP